MLERTPNYRLTSDVVVQFDKNDFVILPGGSFVRPIQLYYVPNHVLEFWPGVDGQYHVFAYTHYGIVPIPRSQVMEG